MENENIEAGKTREEFLSMFPAMQDWVEKMEDMWGVFGRVGMLPLDTDRTVCLIRFERIWHVDLYNGKNEQADKEFSVNLSSEAICALFGLWNLLKDPSRDEWEVLIAHLSKNDPIEKENEPCQG